MSESAFGPVRKWGSNTPTPLSDADYELLDAAQVRLDQDRRYQAIRDEIAAQNKAAWEAHLAHPMVGLSQPTNTVALQMAPVAPTTTLWRKFRVVVVVAAGFWAGVAAAVVAVTP